MEIDSSSDVNQEMMPEKLIKENRVNEGRNIEEKTLRDEITNDETITIDKIITYLVSNDKIVFKSQQRDEQEPEAQEKENIAREIFEKSKTAFLMRFGPYLQENHLDFFANFENSDDELKTILPQVRRMNSKSRSLKQIKNRRYEKMLRLIDENSYFSETEMMKRNPLLYEQLIGRYLSAEEKKERDKMKKDMSFVNILMEGIERDVAEERRKLQEEDELEETEKEEKLDKNLKNEENERMDFDDSSSEDEEAVKCRSQSHWGDYESSNSKAEKRPKLFSRIFCEASSSTQPSYNGKTSNKRTNEIALGSESLVTAEERRLLRNEFTSLMYQSFLDGKDADFDYEEVDHNDSYDNLDIVEHDEEEKYFDSEEPEDCDDEEMKMKKKEESSEDELDIYMSALNQHPVVCQLSKDLQKL